MWPEKYSSMLFCLKLHSFQGLLNFSHFYSVNKLLSASCDICLFSITDSGALYYSLRFAMEVEGIYYIGQVKQKEQAWRMYKEAVQRNQTAGHIDVEVRIMVDGTEGVLIS